MKFTIREFTGRKTYGVVLLKQYGGWAVEIHFGSRVAVLYQGA